MTFTCLKRNNKLVQKMKSLPFYLFILGCLSLLFTTCEKVENQSNLTATRKVKFVLYTEKDFSAENGMITFTAAIKKADNQILWDSILPPMKIKDIPTKANSINFEKLVPQNEASVLRVGYTYSIENVGMSWYWDRFEEGQDYKTVEFSFQ